MTDTAAKRSESRPPTPAPPAGPPTPAPPAGLPATVGALRAAGYTAVGLKDEIRANLVAALGAGIDPFPQLVGLQDTVIPQVQRALLAGHDLVLLGERGQGKTRILRSIAGLLDEWTPVIAGSELAEHPLDPITPESIRRAATEGDELAVSWLHRSGRYFEKLATPDTSVADLVGDVDPVKVAQGRSLGDPETIHFGLVPRAHRGIMAINELPDLAERIQVSLLNVMEERDIQIRGYSIRLPLDVLLVASANPEDYTNRGRIITPLKDRFGAQVHTHYPVELDAEVAVIAQEAALVAKVPPVLLEIVARLTRHLRESPSVDQRSGVSARFAIAAAETLAAAALARSAIGGEAAVARPVDLGTVGEVSTGKVEFESGEEGREAELLEYLLRRSVSDAARAHLRGIDLAPLVAALEAGDQIVTGEAITAAEVLGSAALRARGVPAVVDALAERLEASGDGARAAAVELALEGLYLSKRIAKNSGPQGQAVYG